MVSLNETDNCPLLMKNTQQFAPGAGRFQYFCSENVVWFHKNIPEICPLIMEIIITVTNEGADLSTFQKKQFRSLPSLIRFPQQIARLRGHTLALFFKMFYGFAKMACNLPYTGNCPTRCPLQAQIVVLFSENVE